MPLSRVLLLLLTFYKVIHVIVLLKYFLVMNLRKTFNKKSQILNLMFK